MYVTRIAQLIYLVVIVLFGMASTPGRAAAACTPLPTTNGSASLVVSIPATTVYRVWTRIYSPSANNNGLYMQIDNTYCSIVVGDSAAIPVGNFTWVDYQSGTATNKMNFMLSAGNHTITLAGLDPGVGIDKLLFLADQTCIPAGDGSNCVAAATAIVPTPVNTGPGSNNTATPSVSGVITLNPGNLPDGSTASHSVDGKVIVGNSLDTSALAPGLHIIKTTVHGKDGTEQTYSTMIIVKPKPKLVAATSSRSPMTLVAIIGPVLATTAGLWLLWSRGLLPVRLTPAWLPKTSIRPIQPSSEPANTFQQAPNIIRPDFK